MNTMQKKKKMEMVNHELQDTNNALTKTIADLVQKQNNEKINTQKENEDLKRQLIESQERCIELRQQNELEEKLMQKKFENLSNQKTKQTQKLIQEKKQLYDKYSA
eukprot:292843_1